jgi:uncharacterized protein (UPF0297 family)
MAKSPTFTFRLPAKDLEDVREIAKIYGATSTGGFIAQLVGAMCSGDAKRISEFNTRLMTKMGEQLALDFVAKAEEQAKQRVKKAHQVQKRKASR